jgi:hypothetical protein
MTRVTAVAGRKLAGRRSRQEALDEGDANVFMLTVTYHCECW